MNGAAITAVAETVISANITLAIPGGWNITVQNPPAAPSQGFIFTVTGPPSITGFKGAAPQTINAAAQEWTFTGTGFMSGLAVALTGPSGAASAVVTAVTSTTVSVKAVLNVAGDWKAIATNPSDNASQPFTFKIN